MPDLQRHKELIDEMLQMQIPLRLKPAQVIRHVENYIKENNLPLVVLVSEEGVISVVDA